jgi:oligopeptide transport system ATP-binding protein
MKMDARALLSIQDLEVRFPIARGVELTAVDHVSLDVREGETLGLVGESGCGKTTLGRAVVQLVRPSAGNVRFLGQELTRLSGPALRSMRRHMQMVFQDPRASLDPRMRIRGIVEEPLKVHRLAQGIQRARMAREMLEQVGMEESYDNQRPGELSGGQQQRVGIARALVARPRLVVCDEPVSSLDVSIQAQVVNLLQDLKQRLGVAYLFIAHNLAVVRHISDRVAVMYLGQIVEQADSRQLFTRPLHPYTQGLIASVLRPDLQARAHLAAAQRIVSGDVPSLLHPPTGCRYHTRCPYAQEICSRQRPLLEHAEGEQAHDHRVACHFWREIAALPDSARPSVATTHANPSPSP